MEPSGKDPYLHKGCYFLPVLSSPEKIDSLESFEIRDDDTFIITYPKSGTVWTQNIVSLILYEGHRDGTENITLFKRAPWLEYNINEDLPSRPSPRVICSHLHYYLAPKGLQNKRAKIIYVFRNPKDVLVSSYHFYKILTMMETTEEFDAYLEKFLAGKVPSSLWLDHVEGWYTHKGDFNILFLSYEEMKKDLRSSVLKICHFLGKELTEKEVDDVVDKATFDNMKADSRTNYASLNITFLDRSKGVLLRKGIVGDWKNHMTVAQSERFDRVFKERMEKLPFRFCWDMQEDPDPISRVKKTKICPRVLTDHSPVWMELEYVMGSKRSWRLNENLFRYEENVTECKKIYERIFHYKYA
ncbi:amine sulfotransferase-like isoform X2 [Pituophis catenifer annectens]